MSIIYCVIDESDDKNDDDEKMNINSFKRSNQY